MKIRDLLLILFLLPIIFFGELMAQTANIEAKPQSGGCSLGPVTFKGNPQNLTTVVVTHSDFNSGVLPAGWTSSPYSIGQPCSNNTPDNSNYFWVTDQGTWGHRYIATNAVDVSSGGKIEFYLRYGADDPDSTCEDPDNPDEEVILQYSTDNGSTWITIYDYWDATTEKTDAYYNWLWVSLPIPEGAKTAGTKFRWYQHASTSDSWDHWGLEDVSISYFLFDSHSWKINNSEVSTSGPELSYTFPAAGSYTVNYSFTSSEGNGSDEITYTILSDPFTLVSPENIMVSNIESCGEIVNYEAPTVTINCQDYNYHSKVLLIWDKIGTHTTSLQNALEAEGLNVTLSETSEYLYDGTNPPLDDFGTVIHLNGVNVGFPMKTSGQEALLDFVINKGRTYITSAWSTYEVDANILQGTMSEIVVLQFSYANNNTVTYSTVANQADHPILNGIAPSINLPDGGINYGSARVYASNQPLVLMTHPDGDAVAVRDFPGGGHAICFAHGGNYLNSALLSDTNVQKLYINSVKYGNKDLNSLTITQTAGLPSGSVFPIGTTTNTFVATDTASNTSTCSFDVTVKENVAPIAITQDVTVQLDAGGLATITTDSINNGSTDNCGIVSIDLSQSTFTCADVGENEVILTVTDNSGNTSTATATVTVIDNIIPTVLTQNQTIYLDAGGLATISASSINNGSTDNCGIASMDLSQSTFTCADIGENEVILTVTDNSGNTSTATATVTVIDNAKPVVLTKNIEVTLDDFGLVNITSDMVNQGSNDNCGIHSVTLSKTHFDCSNIGINTVTLTVTDVNGNVSTKTTTVNVKDNTPPSLVLVSPLVIQRVDGHHVKFDIRELVDHAVDNADACNRNLTVAITKASSDEPEDAQGNYDGCTVNDIIISGDGQEIQLRAESNIRGNGRIYTIYIAALDASGNLTEKALFVTVNARGRYAAENDGAAYWVFPGAPFGQVPVLLKTEIQQNNPNPFKSTTEISYSLEQDEFADLAIYSMSGQLIKTLVSEVKQSGIHTVVWKADDNNGQTVPPGMYIYILKTNKQHLTRKMLLLK